MWSPSPLLQSPTRKPLPRKQQQEGRGHCIDFDYRLGQHPGSSYLPSLLLAEPRLLLNPHNYSSHTGRSPPLAPCALVTWSTADSLPAGWTSLSPWGRPWALGWQLHHPRSPGLAPPPTGSPRFTVRTWHRLLVLTCWPLTSPTAWSPKGSLVSGDASHSVERYTALGSTVHSSVIRPIGQVPALPRAQPTWSLPTPRSQIKWTQQETQFFSNYIMTNQ